MATQSFNLNPQVDDDAEFRAWAQAIHDAIAAVGLVQTSDTGQINLASVSKPGGTNTSAGYEIWRFADSLQGTKPVYIKIEYGTGGAANGASLWLTVGTSTNGAGNMGAQSGTRKQMKLTAGDTNYASRLCGATNRLAFLLMRDTGSSNRPFTCIIERSRGDDGTEDANGGIVYLIHSNVGGGIVGVVPYSGTIPPTNQIDFLPCLCPGSGTTAVLGSDTGVFPMLTVAGWMKNPPVGLLGYMGTDFADDATFTCAMYGTTRTYLALGATKLNGSQWGADQAPGAMKPAIIWE